MQTIFSIIPVVIILWCCFYAKVRKYLAQSICYKYEYILLINHDPPRVQRRGTLRLVYMTDEVIYFISGLKIHAFSYEPRALLQLGVLQYYYCYVISYKLLRCCQTVDITVLPDCLFYSYGFILSFPEENYL